jgi:hypothetical protein
LYSLEGVGSSGTEKTPRTVLVLPTSMTNSMALFVQFSGIAEQMYWD